MDELKERFVKEVTKIIFYIDVIKEIKSDFPKDEELIGTCDNLIYTILGELYFIKPFHEEACYNYLEKEIKTYCNISGKRKPIREFLEKIYPVYCKEIEKEIEIDKEEGVYEEDV